LYSIETFSFVTKKYLAELEYKRQKGLAETWKTFYAEMRSISRQIINDSCAPFCMFFYFMAADFKKDAHVLYG
jgi:hypothetical protein